MTVTGRPGPRRARARDSRFQRPGLPGDSLRTRRRRTQSVAALPEHVATSTRPPAASESDLAARALAAGGPRRAQAGSESRSGPGNRDTARGHESQRHGDLTCQVKLPLPARGSAPAPGGHSQAQREFSSPLAAARAPADGLRAAERAARRRVTGPGIESLTRASKIPALRLRVGRARFERTRMQRARDVIAC